MNRLALTAAALSLAAVVVVPAAGAGGAAAQPCRGSQLTGSFSAIRGSAGAGNIVYRLKVVNTKGATCFVSGIPTLTLLDAAGRKLPTDARFGGAPGTLTAIVVPLRKGGHASLTARFSPDVPGPGEGAAGKPCEKTAHELRVVTTGGGSLVVPISPPTPVCEHGSLQLTVFTGR